MTANIANVTNLPATQSAPMAVPARNVTPWRGVRPTTMDEALRMSKAIAVTSFAPTSYTKGKNLSHEDDLKSVTASIFAAIQMGAEVGLSPMASLQNIAVINGKPGLYGPAMLAVVEASGLLADIDEGVRGEGPSMEAYCTVQRVGRKPRTFTFTYAQAKRAGLIGKAGPWTQYPERMFLARARTFALRDIFPDVLAGLSQSVEELMDIPANDVPPPPYYPPVQTAPADAPLPNVTEPEAPITEDYITEYETGLRSLLDGVKTIDALDDLWRKQRVEIKEIGDFNNDARHRLISAFSQKKAEILERQEAAAEAGETSDDAPSNDAPEAEEPAQQPPGVPEDAITTARRAMQADEPAQPKAGVLPPPTAINVSIGEDGQPNWKAFSATAAKALEYATDNDCGDEWLEEWRRANNPKLNELRAVSKKAADYIHDLYMQRLDHFIRLRDEAKAEAEKFPVIPMPYDGENPDWPKFADELKVYIGKTTSHRVAAIWWLKHEMHMKNMREGNPQAAEAVEQALYRKFPQLAK
jgi:hypothetical protein